MGGFFFFQCLQDHIAADHEQKTECDPVIDLGHHIGEADAEEIACHRHQGLESSEPQADNEGLAPRRTGCAQPFPYRYCKGIHRHSDGNEDDLPERHFISSGTGRRNIRPE